MLEDTIRDLENQIKSLESERDNLKNEIQDFRSYVLKKCDDISETINRIKE